MTDGYHVYIHESELDVIGDETSQYKDIETGGCLFGLFSHGGAPTVLLATRPSKRATRRSHDLELDPEVTVALETYLWQQHGAQYIGMWHSHHRIGLMEPSSGDQERARRYAIKHERQRYLEIIANLLDPPARERRSAMTIQLSPFFYTDARSVTRSDTSFSVLPGESPLRRMLGSSVRGDHPLRADDLREALRPGPGKSRAEIRLAASRARLGIPESGRRHGDRADTNPGGWITSAPSVATGTANDAGLRTRPIPDLANYFEDVVSPLLSRLGREYEVEAVPREDIAFEVSAHRRRRQTRLRLLLAWDGSRPVMFSCQVEPGVAPPVPWAPLGPEDRYDLDAILRWGTERLEYMV